MSGSHSRDRAIVDASIECIRTPIAEGALVIAGAGINVPLHLSSETIGALATCQEIWTNVPTALHHLLPGTLPERLCSLSAFYRLDRRRADNYRNIIDHVMNRMQQVPCVGYLTQGHPVVCDSVTAGLINRCSAAGVAIRVCPAISCIDSVLGDVRYDPANGLQIYEATSFVHRMIRVETRAALLLLQIGVFGDSRLQRRANDGGPDLTRLVSVLKMSYPDQQVVQIVRSASGTSDILVVDSCVGQLGSICADVSRSSSLFIPPSGSFALGRPVWMKPV